jgi:hypothetical protein
VPCSARLSCEFNEERAPHFNEERAPHADNLDWLDNPTQKFVNAPGGRWSVCLLPMKERGLQWLFLAGLALPESTFSSGGICSKR